MSTSSFCLQSIQICVSPATDSDETTQPLMESTVASVQAIVDRSTIGDPSEQLVPITADWKIFLRSSSM